MPSERKSDIINELTIFDDAFMRAFFNKDTESTEFVLRIILNNQALKVNSVEIQEPLLNSQGHEGIVDVLATDDKGTIYNIEIQNDRNEASPKRGRYYSSLIDTNFLKRSEPYDKLPETYIIFIVKGDYFKQEKPIYELEMRITELPNFKIDYGVHLLYVNGLYRGKDNLGNLMKDFCCNNPDDMYYNTIRDKTRQIKNIGEGFSMPSQLTKELYFEDRKDMIERILKTEHSQTIEELATIFEIPIEIVQEIASNVN